MGGELLSGDGGQGAVWRGEMRATGPLPLRVHKRGDCFLKNNFCFGVGLATHVTATIPVALDEPISIMQDFRSFPSPSPPLIPSPYSASGATFMTQGLPSFLLFVLQSNGSFHETC